VGDSGKRVSWVELYLDLVFVLAVGQLAHLIVAHPQMHSVWVALGLFFTLWWTWVGFAVIYNRLGEDVAAQRLLFLAASVPIGVAAVRRAEHPGLARRRRGRSRALPRP
jgi:low temperature requirement protein LtrA